MGARIIQIDVTQPLPTLRVDRGHDALWLLVRFGAAPLGWVRCRTRQYGNAIVPDQLAQIIAEKLWLQIDEAMRKHAATIAPLARTPLVSIAICAPTSAQVLERQLVSIAQLNYPSFEAIVVDSDPTSDVLKNVCTRFKFVRYVADPRPGLGYARNTAWQIARGEIVAYASGDTCVDAHWLHALAANYEDAKVACVTGATFPAELITSAQEHFETGGGLGRGFQRRVYKPGTWNATFPLDAARFGSGENLSIRRSTLEQMGGFDVALDAGIAHGAGDLDIIARVLRDGGTLVYEPRAICWHRHARSMSRLQKQVIDQGRAFVAFAMKQTRDLELGNQSANLLYRWFVGRTRQRLSESLTLALRLKPHYPLHLILLEVIGGISGLRAYRRSRKLIRKEEAKLKKRKPAALTAKKAAA